ncbi:hypothetical protein Tco_1219236 [Tanacetum coccineum]
MMMSSKSYNKHPVHKALYDALMQSLLVDEDGMDQGVVEPPTQKKRRHDNEYKNVNDGLEQTWFNDLVNAEKDSLTFDEHMPLNSDFTKFCYEPLKQDKAQRARAEFVGQFKSFLREPAKAALNWNTTWIVRIMKIHVKDSVTP